MMTKFKKSDKNPAMPGENREYCRDLQADLLKRLHKRHLQGALVRSGASAGMWLFALVIFLAGFMNTTVFTGMSFSVLYLIFMNPATLWIGKRITNLSIYKYFSFLINQLEIIGYTAVIYFSGGINTAYLAIIYCALITYVGVVSSRIAPFIITELCVISFGIMVLSEYFGFIPHQKVISDLHLSWTSQLMVFLVTVGLLHLVAFISSYTANILKKRQEELRQRNIELKEKGRELRQTQTQLIQSGKLASIGELASGVAHELNQPLMVIRGTAQLIQRSLKKDNSGAAELIKQLEPIVKNTKRMMNIINHLRTFSRQSKTEFQPVDVNRVVEDSMLMVGEQLKFRNIEVEKKLDVNLPKVKGDANQLEQVFLNLITNARDAINSIEDCRLKIVDCGFRSGGDYTSEGIEKVESKGRLEIITRLGKFSSQKSKNFVEILIRDNGGGISEDKVGKIFDPFFTTKEVGKGTGLGLSISYGIIQDHEGEIEVAETGPQGTTFRIRLPIVD